MHQRHIFERVLGHAIAGIEGVYDDTEKADTLNRLASLVEIIVNPPTVSTSINARSRKRDPRP